VNAAPQNQHRAASARLAVERVEWTTYSVPFVAPFATAHGRLLTREGLLVRLTDTDGRQGLGEGSPLPGFGGTLTAAVAAVQALAPRLIGADGAQREGVLRQAAQLSTVAACALDTALLDLRARSLGLPVAALLGGGSVALTTAVNATVGGPETAAAASAARRAVAVGYTCVKLKVGLGGTAQAELARIAAVRAAIGPTTGLRLDANGAWDEPTALAVLRGAAGDRLELVEQPLAAADLAGMAQLRRSVTTPIAADEAAPDLAGARRTIAAAAADLLVIKPLTAGGLRPAWRMVELAHGAGLGVIVTTTLDMGVGVAAALHLAAALPRPLPHQGLATAALLRADLLIQPLRVAAGRMALPDEPGLGVELDDQQLSRFGGHWREAARL